MSSDIFDKDGHKTGSIRPDPLSGPWQPDPNIPDDDDWWGPPMGSPSWRQLSPPKKRSTLDRIYEMLEHLRIVPRSK